MKNLSEYISPSRLNLFLKSKRAFVQNYVFKNIKPPTAAQEKGKLQHELIYDFIKGEEFVVMPDFGPLRAGQGVPPDSAKWNRDKKAQFLKENENKKIISKDEKGIFLALESYLNGNKKLKELLNEGVKERRGVEKVMHCEDATGKPLFQCRADLLLPIGVVDIKTTGKSEFLEKNKGSEFFKYNEKELAIQAVINSICFQETFSKKEAKFFWLIVLNTYPYGVKLVSFDREYLEDIKKMLLKKGGYVEQYFEFVSEVKKAIGYNFFLQDDYSGNELKDWEKINKILKAEDDDYSEEVICIDEIVAPSYYAKSDLELELGYLND